MDIIIVQGHALKRMLEGLYQKDRIRVLYNGIKLFKDSSQVTVSRNHNSFNILFMGNISFAKGFYDLILAFKKVRQKYPYACLNFAGEIIGIESERNIVPAYFTKDIRDRFLKSNEDIAKFTEDANLYNAKYHGVIHGRAKQQVFRNSDIFVLPSYSEGFSYAVLEAMAWGLPVITTHVGALPEVVVDGVNGFIIKPGDHEKLSEKMIQFIESEGMRTEMSLRNIEKVSRQFNIERIAKDLGDIFVEAALL
jgi:glycosyltransferase involved in cell wall biosynthesis